MQTRNQFIRPPLALASCVAGCIVRDTRMAELSDTDRMNYFPASPLFSVTLVLSGALHIADEIVGLDELRNLPSAPNRLFQTPKSSPQVSWSPGPVWAMTIAFFPEAWQRLGGSLDGTPPQALQNALNALDTATCEPDWPKFWAEMSAVWAKRDNRDRLADWTGSDQLKDWTYHLLGQLAQSGAGRGLRSAQRRLRRWTGHNRQTLEFFARVEDVHRIVSADPTAAPVDVAADAGFTDQSHMGRALKRATGFSPVSLNQKIMTEESFWCYRLLGERF